MDHPIPRPKCSRFEDSRLFDRTRHINLIAMSDNNMTSRYNCNVSRFGALTLAYEYTYSRHRNGKSDFWTNLWGSEWTNSVCLHSTDSLPISAADRTNLHGDRPEKLARCLKYFQYDNKLPCCDSEISKWYAEWENARSANCMGD